MPSCVKANVALAPMTYYKIGGPAQFVATPKSVGELCDVVRFIKSNRLRYFVMGAGSNLLVDSAGFDGVVISTQQLDRTLQFHPDYFGRPVIEVGASVLVIQFLRLCMQNGYDGFEFLVGIPGSLGGVFAMNAGTKSGEIATCVKQLEVIDLVTSHARIIDDTELRFSYRRQHFLKPDEIILRGTLAIKAIEADATIIQRRVTELLHRRKQSQPIDKPSCGSVFKNPSNSTQQAWQLIDAAGLRGQRIGQAEISEQHTNFIVNLGGATSNDVKALIALCQKAVLEKFGITLEPEVHILSQNGGKYLGLT